MKLDWDAIMKRMPIYAYEYEAVGLNVMTPSIDYWRPHEHPPHHMPPRGWTGIDYDLSYDNLCKALDGWLKEDFNPNEKVVLLDIDTGHFSNTFLYRDNLDSTLKEIAALKAGNIEEVGQLTKNWKFIVYRCESDPDFEFTHMMKIVTKTKAERKGK
jgi:hypothetical protein